MDLGLNEFRLDLLEHIKNHPDINKSPYGFHSVACASEDTQPSVIHVLKNRSNSINIDNQNRLHPFYMGAACRISLLKPGLPGCFYIPIVFLLKLL
jgi:ribosomal protein L31